MLDINLKIVEFHATERINHLQTQQVNYLNLIITCCLTPFTMGQHRKLLIANRYKVLQFASISCHHSYKYIA